MSTKLIGDVVYTTRRHLVLHGTQLAALSRLNRQADRGQCAGKTAKCPLCVENISFQPQRREGAGGTTRSCGVLSVMTGRACSATRVFPGHPNKALGPCPVRRALQKCGCLRSRRRTIQQFTGMATEFQEKRGILSCSRWLAGDGGRPS